MFNEFFGLKGDVPNPWPDDEDDAARKRYRTCMSHLKGVIEHGLDPIVEYLDAKSTTLQSNEASAPADPRHGNPPGVTTRRTRRSIGISGG